MLLKARFSIQIIQGQIQGLEKKYVGVMIFYLCELLYGQKLFKRLFDLGLHRVLLLLLMVVVFTPVVRGFFTRFRTVISTHCDEIVSKQLPSVHFWKETHFVKFNKHVKRQTEAQNPSFIFENNTTVAPTQLVVAMPAPREI